LPGLRRKKKKKTRNPSMQKLGRGKRYEGLHLSDNGAGRRVMHSHEKKKREKRRRNEKQRMQLQERELNQLRGKGSDKSH